MHKGPIGPIEIIEILLATGGTKFWNLCSVWHLEKCRRCNCLLVCRHRFCSESFCCLGRKNRKNVNSELNIFNLLRSFGPVCVRSHRVRLRTSNFVSRNVSDDEILGWDRIAEKPPQHRELAGMGHSIGKRPL